MPPLIDRPPIAGHEPAGIVCAIGAAVSAEQAHIGQRVMVHHYQGCTTCNHCRSGWQQLCQKAKPMVRVYGNNDDGGHAPYLKVPANTLVPLPEELSFEAGAAISCGTGTAYNALVRLNLSARDTIAIFGQGPVGLSATLLAHAMNARLIAIDVNAQRLLKGAQEFGADVLIDPAKDDAFEALHELTDGIGVDRALETSGASSARISAVRATKIWGVCCFVGEGGDVTINVSPDMIRRQMTIIASWTFSTAGQADCAKFIAQSRDRRRSDRHRPLVARPGRRSLPAVRPGRRRQGRVSDVALTATKAPCAMLIRKAQCNRYPLEFSDSAPVNMVLRFSRRSGLAG